MLDQAVVAALETRDAAVYLGLSPSTLTKRRVNGSGSDFVKLGRRVLYRRQDLDKWLDSNVRRSTSDPGSKPLASAAENIPRK